MLVKNNIKNKDIQLSFDLTNYLVSHPEILTKYTDDNFVIFVKGDKKVNKRSQIILSAILKKGRNAIKAVKTSEIQNRWNFEIAN
jgi:exopolysaccharide biosynthesis predicted pyruvyltransferase EpsI